MQYEGVDHHGWLRDVFVVWVFEVRITERGVTRLNDGNADTFDASVAFVFLTDIHVKGQDFDALRGRLVAGAVHSALEAQVPVVLLVGGDIAYSGTAAQYEIFENFVNEFRGELARRNLDFRGVILTPGNHDCDFSQQPKSVRAALQLAASSQTHFDPDIAEELVSVQDAFRTYSERASLSMTRISSLQSRCTLQVGENASITIDIINSAWASSLDEQPGKMVLPVPQLEPPSESGVAFAVMHHPPNWFEPWNQRALLRWLDEHFDGVFLGHEHQRESVERVRREVDAQLLMIFGPAFHEANAIDEGFSVHCLDLKQKMARSSDFSWKGEYYSRVPRSGVELPIGNSARKNGQLRFSKSFEEFLNDPGIPFKHGKVSRQLKLDDLYVLPDLRSAMQSGGGATVEDIVDRTDVLLRLSRCETALISAVEQAGKTSLAKYLTRDILRRGEVPLYLDAGKLPSSFHGEITAWINTCIAEQFPEDCREKVEQAIPSKRVALLDNIHQLPGGHDGLSRVLERLRNHHSRIIGFTGEFSAVAGIVEDLSSGRSNVWRDAELFEIPPTSHKLRSEIIRRWVALGDGGSYSESKLEARCRQLKKFVDEVFSRNIIPRYPVYVLLILQQLELASDANSIVANGSHGYLFEELITRTVDDRVKSFKIEIVFAVLSALARKLSKEPGESLSSEEFRDFFDEFLSGRKVHIDFDLFTKEVTGAQILLVYGGAVRFRHNYYYFYFLALSISSDRKRGDGGGVLDELVSYIHTERSANVLTFLAHLGHDEGVIERVCKHADTIFEGLDEAEISEGSKLLARFRTVAERSVLFDGRPSDVSDHLAQRADEFDRGRGGASEQFTDDPGNVSAAFKTIQILGQVIRSRAGNLDGELKKKAVTACSRLARRLMKLIFELVDNHGAEIAHQMSGALEEVLAMDPERARQLANRLLAMLISQLTLASVARVSSAVGSTELRPLVNEMRQLKKGVTEGLFWLGASILADKDFPVAAVDKFLHETKEGEVLPRIVVRELVKRRFYLSPPEPSIKRKYCDLLGLEIRYIPHGRKGLEGLSYRG
ncbi:metallophosphoesterase [Chiayiivirga flava]|uniref:Calcineurin-like phosphoesterase domain-containing protein n=1 Tax=Chiayiivirga flava TaxID=659595 RepID=A0A7W8DAN9_9GAMM|nr:hypothetical protein [Chiayiivirga flava]